MFLKFAKLFSAVKLKELNLLLLLRARSQDLVVVGV